jgi:hypothetical protein
VAKLNFNKIHQLMLHMHLRVELPDGNYTLVSEEGDEGAVAEVNYVELDQDPEGPAECLADEGKHLSIYLLPFKSMQLSMFCLCIMFRS